MADPSAKDSKRDLFHIGKIGAAHGLNGEVRVSVLSSDTQRFENLRDCLLTDAQEKTSVPAKIESARSVAGKQLLKLAGTTDRDAAEKLRGFYLSVSRAQALELQSDEYFIADLIGCKVFDARHGDLGRVTQVLPAGTQDVYVVAKKGNRDLLLPAAKAFVRHVDLTHRTIQVCLPDGLFELYRGE